MPRNSLTLLPSLQRHLTTLGENIRLARLRRQLTALQVAERAGIARGTLSSIEKGDPNVAMGAYAKVLLCLGLDADLETVGSDDVLGQKLQDARLTLPRSSARRPRAMRLAGIKPATARSQVNASEAE